jgi:hypothetical protein
MDSTLSLFSRARPRKPVEKKIRGFLALPGELRNEIYKFYFPADFRCEIVGQGTDFDPLRYKMMKLGLIPVRMRHMQDFWAPTQWEPFNPRAGTIIRVSRRLGKSKQTRVDGLRTNWPNSPCALILVCKMIHRESVVFLYQNTTFVFNAPVRIKNFLETLPSTNLALVTRLELHYTNYGNFHSLYHSAVKDFRRSHLATWTTVCKAVVRQLVNLQELHLWMYITDSPLFFDLRQEWLSPLLPFRRCCLAGGTDALKAAKPKEGTAKGLALVSVYFDTWWSRPDAFFDRPSLTRASADLHRLFGNAIRWAILGESEEKAMAEFKEAWEGEYAQWQHHLQFSTTRW